MRFLTTSVLIPGSRAASPRKTGTIVLQFALVYYWCKELATLPRGFNQFADSAYPRRIMRADERTRTAYPCSSYELACGYPYEYHHVPARGLPKPKSRSRQRHPSHCVPPRTSPVAVNSFGQPPMAGRHLLTTGN